MPKQKLIERAIKSSGGIQEFNRKFHEYCKNDSYVQANLKELLKTYNEKWIAIYKNELVSSGNTYKDVAVDIDRKGLSSDNIVIQFISNKPKMFIL